MGDAQSAQREGKKDAAAEEESGKVDDVQTEGNIEDKPLRTNGQISELNGKADSTIAAINGHCEDDIAAVAILSANEDIKQTEEPLKGVTKEETPLENADFNEKTLPDEVDANEEAPEEVIEMDAKQNDINESFRRFFSNIGLKLTVKKGSTVEIPTNVPEEESKQPEEESNEPEEEEVKDSAEEMKSEHTEQNVDFNTAQEAQDNDSTTCPTTTDVTSDNVLENAEEKSAEVQPDNAEAEMTSSVGEDPQQGAAPEEEPRPTSPTSAEEEVVESPLKRFFTTGIFSGLRKKKKPTEDEAVEKELVDMGKNEEETVQDQQEMKTAATEVDAGPDESELKEESAPEKAKPVDQENVTEILNSQEKEKVQASPLKKLLSGSSLKKQKKRQKGRKSSDAKSSDSGEHVSDQLLSSTESAENQKEETPAQPSPETAREEDSAWASFKRLLTPKKRVKKSTPVQEDAQIPAPVEEAKPSEGEQISDHSTEEGKKRKDSSVSWEAVLCGSGKRRSRKTSDSEDEGPQIDDNKQDSGPKESAESPLESSNEEQAGSPPEDDGGSTWKSFKKLVTPKRKAKDEDESKDNVQSDSEVTQDETSFSIKKLLPGRKKRKSVEKQDHVSSDEADRELTSGDEEYETPSVVPLSEFDTAETVVQIQTQADVESYPTKEGDNELQKDLTDETAEPVLPSESLKTEAEEVQDEKALANEVSKVPITAEQPDDLTELISKHQQLSDIPEEGLITETMATPLTEEGNKDDTIAEDLIEITSEAITAPEPADITAADETEMMSAVSQLSESSKTSGNTTPVPAEYDVVDTETLLQQVAETISLSPKAIPVYTEEPSSERIVCSVSPQIHETFVKEEPNILEIHRRTDATAIKTGLNTEAIDAISELAATAQTESLSDMKEALSTEIVSEVPTEEFDTADAAVDELHKADVSEVQENIKELEMTDNEIAEVVTEEGSLDQEENVALKADSQETESAPTEAEETQDEKQEPQILEEKEDQISEQFEEDQTPLVADESPEKSEDIPSEEVTEVTAEPQDKEPQTEAPKEVTEEQENVQEATLDLEEGQSLEKKDALSEDIPPADLEPTDVPIEQEIKEPQTDPPKGEHEEVTQALEVVKSATLDSEESSVQSLEKKEPLSEEVPVTDIDSEEPKETGELPPEASVEPENKEPPTDASKDEVTDTVEAVTVDSEESIKSPEKEEPLPEIVPPADIETDESKQTAEPENKEPPTDASKDEVKEVTETVDAEKLDSDEGRVQSPEKEEPLPEIIPPAEESKQTEPENKETETVHSEVLVDEPSAPLDSEEGTAQSLEKKVEDVPAAEMVKDEPEKDTVPTEVNVEPVDVSKTQHAEQPDDLQPEEVATSGSEAGSPQVLEKEAKSEDVPAVETDELKHVTEINAESEKEEQPAEPDVTETEAETKSAQSAEESSAQEDISEPAPETEAASVTDEIETKVVAQVDPVLETNEDQKTESTAQEVEDSIPEVVDEIQTLTAVHVSLVNKEASSVQLLEKTVFSEETPAPHVNNVEVSDEPTHEGHLCAVQVSVEGEKVVPLLEAEAKTAAVEHAVVAQVITCNLKDVSAAIPDVLIENPSEVHEPLIDKVLSETELKETIETATPLEVKDNVTETAEEGSAVMMMHVPAVEFEDNHRIQVQVVDIDIKSAENIVDTAIEVGVTETKEVIEVYQENIDEVENLSATAEIEADVMENTVTVQEVTQHVKESLEETTPEPEPTVSVEQEVKEQPDAVTEETETVESGESKAVEGHGVMKDSTETSMEGQEEVPAAISDNSETTAENQESENFMQASDVPETLEESTHDPKEDLEETKAEKSEIYVLAQETPEQLAARKASESETERLQAAQNQIVASSNAALAVPQNTGIISSVGNVESPSSLSLEFKLNIQFGGIKAPASPPPPIEKAEPLKHTDVSEVGVQAVEPVDPVRLTNATQRVESDKQAEMTEVAVQATENQEPAVSLDSTETAVIANLPVLLDVGIQAMETTETVEKLQSTERVTPNVHVAEIIQPVRQTERREVFLSQPVLSEACDHETKEEEEPVKQTEEETDQDVWLDAEEDILIEEETEAPPVVMEEPIETQAESKQEEKVEAEHEFEMAPSMKTEEEENQQETRSAEGLCDVESDGEDFAVALEHPEVSTATVTTEEWD